MSKEQEIYLVRHLPTSMNKSGAYMGREFDPEILADEIAGFLRKLDYFKPGINLINPIFVSSPSLRCRQTMDIVMKHLGVVNKVVRVEPDFRETDFGEATGLTVVEIKERFPEVYAAWLEDQSKTAFPGGETYQDVQVRAWDALQKLLSQFEGSSSVVVCTHVDVIKMILFKVTNTPISSKPLFVISNGAICTLVTSKNGLKLKLGN